MLFPMYGLQNVKFEKKNSLYWKYFEKLYMGEFWNCSSISPNTILYIKAELYVLVLEASEFRPLDPSSFVLLYSIKRRSKYHDTQRILELFVNSNTSWHRGGGHKHPKVYSLLLGLINSREISISSQACPYIHLCHYPRRSTIHHFKNINFNTLLPRLTSFIFLYIPSMNLGMGSGLIWIM